nr:IS110 family transposase [Nocardia terpenica]
MDECAGRQYVGVDLHRRRTVLVCHDENGQRLGWRRIVNDAQVLTAAIDEAGAAPRVVVEATYGWYWAVDALRAAGAEVHLAHPLGVKGFRYRRVKNDVVDAGDLADLLRMHRLPEAWISPPLVRELRELVRYRCKLVGMRTSLKQQVHGVLAKAGVAVPVSDLFGVRGRGLLAGTALSGAYAQRVASLLRLIDIVGAEIDTLTTAIGGRLRDDAGYAAIQQIPGVGPVLAAVIIAEIGDIHRFGSPARLCSWAGLTPPHRESDTTVHRGHVTKQGSRRLWWALVEAIQRGSTARIRATATGSPTGVAATSPRPPPPANCSPWSTTGCVTARSVPWPARPREHPGRGGRVVASLSDPHPAWSSL